MVLLLLACRIACADGVPGEEPVPGILPASVVPGKSPVVAQFVQAMRRIGQRLPDLADSADLNAYVIHDYLVAARLRRDLALGPNDELDSTIDAFVTAHAGQPVVRALKHEWLLSLGERRRWQLLLPHSVDTTDPVLSCYRLTARLADGESPALAADALARFNAVQKSPPECNGIYAWLRTLNLITPGLIENKVRAALAADNPRLAHDVVIELSGPRAVPLLQWLQLLDTPKATLTALALNPDLPVEFPALSAGFTRLAFSDDAAAQALLPALLQHAGLTALQRDRLRRAAALGAASSRAPTAVAAFAALPEDADDTQVQEWRVRAALWADDFATALRWMELMPPALATQPRWRYWHARAVAATAGPDAAAPAFAALAGLRDYYAYLAADRVQQPYKLNIKPSPDDTAAQDALAAEPGLLRAHALFECGMTDDAGAEWTAALGAAKPAVKVQAAHLASRWGWYAQTIASLAQAGEWDDVTLRYPRPYGPEVAQAARQNAIPADWLLAVMRQESLFRPDAVSRADARGLMQVQPATAAAVARRAHLPAPARDALYDPATAIAFGAAYLRELLDRYDGRLDAALAAYNAGPVSVARWTPSRPVNADVWIENIPYTETRGYVQHIFEHIVAFAAVRGAEPPRLSGLMMPMVPNPP